MSSGEIGVGSSLMGVEEASGFLICLASVYVIPVCVVIHDKPLQTPLYNVVGSSNVPVEVFS